MGAQCVRAVGWLVGWVWLAGGWLAGNAMNESESHFEKEKRRKKKKERKHFPFGPR